MSGDRRTNKTIQALFAVALLIFAFGALAQTVTTGGENTAAKQRLIGAWHLVYIDVPGPDGNATAIPQPQGMLIYTRDGTCPCN
jgi:hypothetical protein